MTKKQWHVNRTEAVLTHPNGIHSFERITLPKEWSTLNKLQDMADKLNYAEENMPTTKKTVEEFLAMDEHALDLACRSLSSRNEVYKASFTACWSILRPEMIKRGYDVETHLATNLKSSFSLFKSMVPKGIQRIGEPVEESSTVTLARFLCACYLYVMQEGVK